MARLAFFVAVLSHGARGFSIGKPAATRNPSPMIRPKRRSVAPRLNSLPSTAAVALNLSGGSVATTVVPALGVALANAMMFSSFPAVLAARRRGSIEGMNIVPFAMTLANCLSWCLYALTIGDVFIFLANGPGVLVGLFLTTTGMSLGSREQRAQLERLTLSTGAVLLGSCATMGLALSGSPEKIATLGAILANVICIMFYMAPLSALAEVVRTRCARTLILPLAATAWTNSALWTSYGIATKNIGVFVPNGIGLILSSVQLALLFIFRQGSPTMKTVATSLKTETKQNPVKNPGTIDLPGVLPGSAYADFSGVPS